MVHLPFQIEAGQVCTFVLHGDGQVSACGKGSYGRLGFGDSNNQMTPRILHIGGPVKDISSSKASDGHTLALTERGEVFSWGDGKSHLKYLLVTLLSQTSVLVCIFVYESGV